MSKKLFIKGISFSYLRQIITLIIGIVSLPLTLDYFGTAVYGILVLILGLVGYLNNIAFGIPSAMITLTAKALNQTQKYLILQKSFTILLKIISSVLIIFIIAILIDTGWIISLLGNIAPQYIQISKNIFIFFVVATLLKIPLTLYMQFFTGINLVYWSEIYQIITMLLTFFSLLITIYIKLDIYWFIILTLGSQLLISIISMIHVIWKYANWKNNKSFETITNHEILKSGFAFFQVGIAASIVWSTDNLVISHFLSPEYVTSYSIAFKIFTYTFLFSAIINGVVGPIYGHAFIQNDWKKIERISSSILKLLPIFGAGVWVFLLFFAKELILLWTHNEMAFGGYLLIFSLGLYGYILSFVNTYATVIFSLNYAHKTLYIAWGEAILNFIFSIILIQLLGLGGVALGTALAAFLTGFIFLPQTIKKLTDENIIYNYSYVKKHFIFLVIPSVLIALLSTGIDYIQLKIIIFLLLVIVNIVVSWKLFTNEDKNILRNLIQRKG